MPFLAPLMWLATLLRWSFAQATSGFAHVLAATMSIPSYFSALWAEELDNLACYFDTVLKLIVWSDATLANLHATTEGKLADASDYFTVTLPEDFHDTFGNLLGDVSRKEWNDLFSGILFIATITAMWWLCMHLSEAVATHSPSPLAPEDSPAEARELPPTPPRPTPVPLEPLFFEHFPGDVEYFKKAAVYYPPTYNLPSRLSFLQHPSSISTRSYPPEPAPPMPSPTKEPGGAQRVCEPSDQQETSVQDSRTPHEIPEVALPQADVPRPVSSITTSEDAGKMLPHIPTTSLYAFEMVCADLARNSNLLEVALTGFLDTGYAGGPIYGQAKQVADLIVLAWDGLKPHRQQLTTFEGESTNWAQRIEWFWMIVHPHG